MPNRSCFPDPPSADGPTDVEVARYVAARCRELETISDRLDNPELARLLGEARERAEAISAEGDRDAE